MSTRQTWKSESGVYTVHLETTFLENASCIARDHYPKEVGAPLVGQYSDDGEEAFITDTAPLSSDSKGSRFAFRRGIHGLKEYFRNLFNASHGRVHYVGEWHSHPGGSPFPSNTDDSSQNAIARSSKTRCAESILVILGVYEREVEYGVFVYSRTRGRQVLQRR